MPNISCPNGHVLSVQPQHDGKRIKCPKCQAIFVVNLGGVQGGAPAAVAPTPKPAAPPPLPPAAPAQEPFTFAPQPRADEPQPRGREDEPRPRRDTVYDEPEEYGESRRITDKFARNMMSLDACLVLYWWRHLLYLIATAGLILGFLIICISSLFIASGFQAQIKNPQFNFDDPFPPGQGFPPMKGMPPRAFPAPRPAMPIGGGLIGAGFFS